MKVEQIQPKVFQPVTLTLETQDEVNGLFALLNHVKVAECVNMHNGFSEQLEPYITPDYRIFHNSLDRHYHL